MLLQFHHQEKALTVLCLEILGQSHVQSHCILIFRWKFFCPIISFTSLASTFFVLLNTKQVNIEQFSNRNEPNPLEMKKIC